MSTTLIIKTFWWNFFFRWLLLRKIKKKIELETDHNLTHTYIILVDGQNLNCCCPIISVDTGENTTHNILFGISFKQKKNNKKKWSYGVYIRKKKVVELARCVMLSTEFRLKTMTDRHSTTESRCKRMQTIYTDTIESYAHNRSAYTVAKRKWKI